MRALIVAGLVAAMATPALAQSIADEIAEANGIFTGGHDRAEMTDGTYLDFVSADLAGDWAFVSPFIDVLDDRTEFDKQMSSACARHTVAIAVSDPLALIITRGSANARFISTYLYEGSATFSAQVDAKALLAYLGLTGSQRRAALLAIGGQIGEVQIYRPAADVLVLTRARGYPDIYARCPGSGASAEVGDLAGLQRLFGDEYDRRYASRVQDPVMREAFVACIAGAFSTMSVADIAILVASGMNPPPNEMARIEAANPQVGKEAPLCFQAVEAALNK